MSFDQDPNEQANISGADLAIMCAEMAQLRAEVARLTAELDAVRTGDTCGRQCEGTAYRIAARNLQTELTKAELHRDTYRDAWQTVAADIAELRASKPAFWTLETHLQQAAKTPFLCRVHPTEDAICTVPLYARPVPAAQSVPDGYALVPIEPTPEMLTAARKWADTDAFGIVSAWPSDVFGAMLAAAPQPPSDHVPGATEMIDDRVSDAGKTIEKGAQ